MKRNDRIAAAGISTLPANIAAVQMFLVPSSRSVTFMTPMTGSTNAIAHSNRKIFSHQNPTGSALRRVDDPDDDHQRAA